MRKRAIEYPHPVLNEYSNDYKDCNFSINVLSHSDNGAEIVLEIECALECEDLAQVIALGDAKIILRLTCYRTSYRGIFDLNSQDTTLIRIPKKQVVDTIDLQAMVVATKEIPAFKLPQFNADYFGEVAFNIRKGDVLANEPGIKIKLNTTLEKNMAGIVQVRGDKAASEMRVSYPEITEENPELTDYIVITLPDMDYKNYGRLMSKKHLKSGVERFVQASVILPAITEAVGKLRAEESTVGDDGETITQYRGTVWADSIYDAMARLDIGELFTCSKSDYEIANEILGNVMSDSISNLMQKLTEWSTIREEDADL